MKILVIGNGFDLEHGLSTKYKDFLDFMQGIKLLNENITDITKDVFCNRLEMKVKHEVDYNVKNYFCNRNLFNISSFDKWREEENGMELVESAKNNIWIKYFIDNMNYEKEGWIDLESEISNVIKCFEYMKNYSEHNRKGLGWPREQEQEKVDKQEVVQKIIGYSELDIEPFELIGKKLEVIIGTLNEHLNNLVRCLEIYLADCVEQIPVDFIAPDVDEFKPNRVLSFNYTNTYKRIYASSDKVIQYDYIHGKANIDRLKEKNDMVLGIDEYLDDDSKNKKLEFIGFKKYFQRIYKKTGNIYTKWIQEIHSTYKEELDNKKMYKEKLDRAKTEKEVEFYSKTLENLNENKNEIYIFGHSLDITDKDILKELIKCENTKTTIFYCNQNVYSQQIVNLVKVIEQDELIKRVSGANPTIIFRQQQIKRRISKKNITDQQKQLNYLLMSYIYNSKGGLTTDEILKKIKEDSLHITLIEFHCGTNHKDNILTTLQEYENIGALSYDKVQNKWNPTDNFKIYFEDIIIKTLRMFKFKFIGNEGFSYEDCGYLADSDENDDMFSHGTILLKQDFDHLVEYLRIFDRTNDFIK